MRRGGAAGRVLAKARLIPISLALLTACAHSSGNALAQLAPRANEPVSLEQLADRLQLVRGHLDLGEGDVSSLLGQDAWTIREHLGMPDESEWSKGISIFPATWSYRFFRTGDAVHAGGHILLLRFDGAHRCIDARWLVVE